MVTHLKLRDSIAEKLAHINVVSVDGWLVCMNTKHTPMERATDHKQ